MKFKTIYMIAVAGLGWFGLSLQLYLILTNTADGMSFGTHFFNYFSYFTILTNILTALSLTIALTTSSSALATFLARPPVHAALAMYILIVGITYVSLLQGLWKPQGWQLVADIILHYAIPILYPIYWLLFVPKGYCKWMHSLGWLIYPALYFVYSIVRGSVTGWYPYPFLDVKQNGMAATLTNALVLLGGFVLAALVVIIIDKRLAQRQRAANLTAPL